MSNAVEDYTLISGRKIYYRLLNPQLLSGERPLLVFLHEGLGCSALWRDFPELLSRSLEMPALLYDRLRYGKSDAAEEPFHNRYMHVEAFEYLPVLLDNLNLKQPLILVGHSDGGTIALLFAARFPQRTLAVISEADHVVNEEVTRQGIAAVVKEFENGPLRKRLEKYHHEKTEALVRGWSGMLLSEEGLKWSIVDELRDIHAPVMVIQGRNDAFGSAEQIHAKLKNISGDVYVSFLNNCGHVPHHEQRDIVLQTMKQFIENQTKTSG